MNPNCMKSLLSIGVIALAAGATARADIIIELDSTIIDVSAVSQLTDAGLSTGDSMIVRYTIDTTVIDTDAFVGFGEYLDAVTSVSVDFGGFDFTGATGDAFVDDDFDEYLLFTDGGTLDTGFGLPLLGVEFILDVLAPIDGIDGDENLTSQDEFDALGPFDPGFPAIAFGQPDEAQQLFTAGLNSITVIPAPGAFLLASIGAGAVVFIRRRSA